MKFVHLAFNVLAAVAGFIASLYWFKASKTKLPDIDKATRKPTSPISMLALTDEFIDAARLNRIASRWSAAAAIFTAIALLLNNI